MGITQLQGVAQLHWYGTITLYSIIMGYSTMTRVWHSYMGMAQLRRYGTITQAWHNYVRMAQFHGTA